MRYTDTPILADKSMFASDHPLLPIDRALQAFLDLPIKAENVEKMLWKNAARLL
jgi:predicted TIM-barrel fold metal-dependent hydrolase